MSNEPSQFRRGKAFHKLIQKEWEQEAESDVKSERHVRKHNGRQGRMDVFVNDEDSKGPIAIVEVKATDWDKIKKKNIRHNVRCKIRQIWSYIESQILNGQYVKDGEGKDVCPGIIFPKLPRSKERLELIEQMFEEEGIAVVWHDETIEERKMRS